MVLIAGGLNSGVVLMRVLLYLLTLIVGKLILSYFNHSGPAYFNFYSTYITDKDLPTKYMSQALLTHTRIVQTIARQRVYFINLYIQASFNNPHLTCTKFRMVRIVLYTFFETLNDFSFFLLAFKNTIYFANEIMNI